MRRHISPRSTCASAQAGFTLIEVLVSAFIVLLISAAVAQGLISSAHLSGYERHRSQADDLAQQDQERLRGLTSTQLDGLNQTQTVTLDGTAYTITSSASFLSSTGTASCGSSGNGAVAYYSTNSTVSWQDISGAPVKSLSEHSVITPPPGGTLLTQVTNQTGTGLAGVTVTATGPDVQSGTTDVNGCLILADLAAGSYSVRFAANGYVDKNGNSTITDTASATASATATTATNPEVIGQAGSVIANFSTNVTGGSLAGQQSQSLSWFGAGSSSQMTASNTASSSSAQSSLTAGSLFPFAFTGSSISYTGNYRVWAGKCLQEETPAAYNSASVSPGSSQTLAVQEPALNVVVTYNGVRVAPAHVKLTFGSTSGTACTDAFYPPIAATAATSANGSLASPGQPFASTTTSGATASGSGLTGTYSVCADYNSHKVTVASVTNNNMAAPTAVTVAVSSGSSSGTC